VDSTSENGATGYSVPIKRTVVNHFARNIQRLGILNQPGFRFVFTMIRPLLPTRSRQDQQKLKDSQEVPERNSRMQVEA
jgi:hypothetical protein